MPSAEIVAVGTEILLGDIVDTNSQALGRALADYGITHHRRTTVGDNLERCRKAIAEALERTDIVFTIGGLGPTADDLTRNAIASAVGEKLVIDEPCLAELKTYVASRGRKWKDSYGSQAAKPENATLLRNEVGTAPGIHWERHDKHIIAMPGPRGEFLSILEKSVRPFLRSVSDTVIYSRTLRVLGVPEAVLADMFAAEMDGENPTVSPYAKVGEAHLRITASASDQQSAQALVDPIANRFLAKLGDRVYSSDGKNLAEVVVDRLVCSGSTLSIAESCTGGMLGEALTKIPGASRAFLGGIIAYSDRVKEQMVDVDHNTLHEHGSVSNSVCALLASGAKQKFNATFGIGITGVAGPGGGTKEKPVGLVYVAVSSGNGTEVVEHRFRGGRDHVREASVQAALAQLYREIK
jgi:nicotinamide-nucleotide amidase